MISALLERYENNILIVLQMALNIFFSSDTFWNRWSMLPLLFKIYEYYVIKNDRNSVQEELKTTAVSLTA